eukprot:gene9315-14439_t
MLKVLEPISGDLREIKQVREKRSQRRERKMEALKDLWAREASRLDAEAFGDVQRNEQWKAAVQQQVGERERQLLREVDPGREPMPPVLWHTPDGKVPMARLAERQRETEDFERYMQRVEAGENVEWAPASPDLKRIKHPGRTVAPGYEPLPANGSRASPSYVLTGDRQQQQQQQRHVSCSPGAGSPRHVSEHDSRDATLLLAAMRHADSMPLPIVSSSSINSDTYRKDHHLRLYRPLPVDGSRAVLVAIPSNDSDTDVSEQDLRDAKDLLLAAMRHADHAAEFLKWAKSGLPAKGSRFVI